MNEEAITQAIHRQADALWDAINVAEDLELLDCLSGLGRVYAPVWRAAGCYQAERMITNAGIRRHQELTRQKNPA